MQNKSMNALVLEEWVQVEGTKSRTGRPKMIWAQALETHDQASNQDMSLDRAEWQQLHVADKN